MFMHVLETQSDMTKFEAICPQQNYISSQSLGSGFELSTSILHSSRSNHMAMHPPWVFAFLFLRV